MGALLLAAVLATPPAATAPTAAVFVHPLTSVVLGGLAGAPCVSAGAQVAQSERWSLTFDLAVVSGPGTASSAVENYPGGVSVSGSLGPTWRIAGTGLRGLFVTPKVSVIVSHNSAARASTGFRTLMREVWQTAEVGAGVDLAFHWTFGRFFLGSVVGLGGGWVFGQGQEQRTFTSTFGGATWAGWLNERGPRGSGPVVSLNVQLLRVGVTF
ncbi:MAG: hypothetical protein Q8S33_11765 [Myxococcales bacterium]|nr:hypothetical protein [Myxococcales bacterium]